MSKLVSLQEALLAVTNGCSLMFGGFGGVGTPPSLVDGMLLKGIQNLTAIGNDAGFPEIGIGRLVCAGRIRKLIASHIGSNPVAGQLMTEGRMEVEFCPQGTLIERIRAGGMGLGGILTDIGIGTIAEQGKEKVLLAGKQFLIEPALTADVAIVSAKQADPYGNLVYDQSARNFNPLVAMAGRVTIAEVDEVVELGELDPESIVTPGVFVNHVVVSEGVNWKWAWE